MNPPEPFDAHALMTRILRLRTLLGEAGEPIVLIGGTAPLFHRRMWSGGSMHAPRLTRDTDLLHPGRATGGSLLKSVLASGDLVAAPHRSGHTVFQWVDQCTTDAQRAGVDRAADYIEFLAPLRGSSRDRQGRPVSPVELEPGLRVEALQYLSLLEVGPLLFRESMGATDSEHPLQVVHPVPYVLQKGLLLADRKVRRRPKDAWYVWDVAMVVPAIDAACWWDAHWGTLTGEHRRWAQRAIDRLEAHFRNADAPGPRDVHTEWDTRPADPHRPGLALITATVRDWLRTAIREPLAQRLGVE